MCCILKAMSLRTKIFRVQISPLAPPHAPAGMYHSRMLMCYYVALSWGSYARRRQRRYEPQFTQDESGSRTGPVEHRPLPDQMGALKGVPGATLSTFLLFVHWFSTCATIGVCSSAWATCFADRLVFPLPSKNTLS